MQFIKEIMVHYYGRPLKIVGDRGTMLTSRVFKKFCED